MFATFALVATSLAPPATAQPSPAAVQVGPVADPLPTPAPSGIGLRLREIARLPQSSTTPAAGDSRLNQYNRVNHLGEVPDGSGRLFVPDMNGKLYTLKHDGTGQRTYLDVRAAIGANFHNHQGLGSGFGFVAFHPEFATNGKFYTAHTEVKDALKKPTDLPSPNSVVHGVITEWTAANPAAATFAGTRRELLRIGFEMYLHGFQEIGFNPTAAPGTPDHGLLYPAVGDGGVGYRSDVPQDLAVPQGKILRIDPAGTGSGNGKYGIPASNPFLGRPGALRELFAIGVRDPYRFSWDAGGTHKMFLGHIGEKVVESVYEVRPGANLGWGQREGHLTYRRDDPKCQLYPLPADDAKYGYTYPVAGFDHNRPGGGCGDSGTALIGGFVYRGSAIPALRGKYVYGEGVKGLLYYADEQDMRAGAPIAKTFELAVHDAAGRRTTLRTLTGKSRVDLRFGADAAGELYVLAKANGKVWKVTGTVQTAEAFGNAGGINDLRITGTAAPAAPATLSGPTALSAPTASAGSGDVSPAIAASVVHHYDFEHPVTGDAAKEQDIGRAGASTPLSLVNGGAAMRTADGAFPGSRTSVQLKQVRPDSRGNDDWKAGVHGSGGVASMRAFTNVRGISIMTWVKVTGEAPARNSGTSDPSDLYGAIGFAGILSGDSDGHAARALLEAENHDGAMRLIALARRLDSGEKQYWVSEAGWRTLIPPGRWVFLAGTFDFDTGAIGLYVDGRPVEGSYAVKGDPWQLAGPPEPDLSSATDPRGIKVGGSYPRNDREANACNCRVDGLMFLDRAVTADEVRAQHEWVTRPTRVVSPLSAG
ncbi:hypothetical protein ADL03_12795 [Nocardia sp. NRRL S-836]|nr:hypothetical protein ADL03_12795 [Nocardia sp. NRRL S-836]